MYSSFSAMKWDGYFESFIKAWPKKKTKKFLEQDSVITQFLIFSYIFLY